MTSKNVPKILWDYCIVWCCDTRSNTALNLRGLDGRTPATVMTGDTADISHLSEFGFYAWVWFISPQGTLDHNDMQRRRLGKYLGSSDSVGEAMCGTVLTEKGTTVDRTSIIPLSVEDENSEHIKAMKQVFDKVLEAKLKIKASELKPSKKDSTDIDLQLAKEMTAHMPEVIPDRVEYEPWSLEELGYKAGMETIEEEPPPPELADADDLDLNSYIAAKVKLPVGGHTFANAKVIGRARDECGELIGKSNSNPFLDTSVYEVKFDDGPVDRYSANTIAENIYSQIDKDGNTLSYIEDIVDHKCDDDAVKKKDGTIKGPNGMIQKKKTTKGWWLLAELQNGTTEWIKLKDIKESNPVQVAEYAKSRDLLNEPAFAW